MGAEANVKTTLRGRVRYVSVSPHGDPEGVVLENGSFIKMPPHALMMASLITRGAEISAIGELMAETPNRVLHHAKVNIGSEVVADDSIGPAAKERLKSKHAKDLKKREDAPVTSLTVRGRVVACGVKPKGEIDRIILEDGTSVHVPKDIDLSSEDFAIGDELEVKGEARMFGTLRFVKAKSVVHSS